MWDSSGLTGKWREALTYKGFSGPDGDFFEWGLTREAPKTGTNAVPLEKTPSPS
jgi:hypothetical protein